MDVLKYKSFFRAALKNNILNILKHIALVTPTLTPGGSERVISEVANYFQFQKNVQVHIILLTGGEVFYDLGENIKIHLPNFDYRKYNRVIFTLKIFKYLRNKLNEVRPYSFLCFGGRYNSFAILAAYGLGIKTYISDRSRPGISYGWLIDYLNIYIYKKATGIITQTQYAKSLIEKSIDHSNIRIIGNPIQTVPYSILKRKKIILNVGRFIESKHQDWLIDYFNQINNLEWKLWFVGDGPTREKCTERANQSKLKDNITFWGNQKKITDFYLQSSIFAFTSTSEGFPNALGEAMAAGCACISFDCTAGPSDLIDNSINGFLVDLNNHKHYIEMLRKLMLNEHLRNNFSTNAKEKMKKYSTDNICYEFYQTLIQ